MDDPTIDPPDFVHPDDELPFGERLPGDAGRARGPKGRWATFPVCDLSVDQYDCEACHAKRHYTQDLEVLFADEQNRAARAEFDRTLAEWVENPGDRPVPEIEPPRTVNPADGYSRWLVTFHDRHPDCPRAGDDVLPAPAEVYL